LRRFLAIYLIATSLFVVPALVAAQTATTPPDDSIGMDELLGAYAAENLGFLDADGDSVYLRDVIRRPTVIALVYFHCPTICKPLLGGVAELIEKTELTPGEDYDVFTISFDEHDNPTSAREIRESFADPIKKIKPGGWRFLTADSTTIAEFTNSVGFHFKRREKDFAHPSGLIVLSPDGKIVRYLYGLQFMPFDLKMAVTEANEGKVAPTIARVLRFCFSYDPEGQRYVFNVNRIAGASIVLLMVGWVVYITTIGRRHRERSKG